MALGFFYSADVPLLRWKRSPVLAAACIFGVRALAVQFGFYFHMVSTVLARCGCLDGFGAHAHADAMHVSRRRGTDSIACSPRASRREATLTFPLLFASAFMSAFSVVIAFFKDIPDVKGDRGSSIQTLPVRIGVRRAQPRAQLRHTIMAASPWLC